MVKNRLRLIFTSFLIYMFLDLAVQITNFLDYGSYIGIKNFLPFTLGLLLGPYGVIGSLLASLMDGIILKTAINELALELIAILLDGIGMWQIWHFRSKDFKVDFKKNINFLKYFLIILVLSIVTGCIGILLVDYVAAVKIIISNLLLTSFLGIPTIIIFSEVLCIAPILPKSTLAIDNDTIYIKNTPEDLDKLNEKIDEIITKKPAFKNKKYNIENALEELLIRIYKNNPDTKIAISFLYDDLFKVKFVYKSSNINPFSPSKNEDEASLFGLKVLARNLLKYEYHYFKMQAIVKLVIQDGIFASLNNNPESLEEFNAVLLGYCKNKNVAKKKKFEVLNIIEELYIRITKEINNTKITININYTDVFNVKIVYSGKKYNPLVLKDDDDELDVMALKLVRLRALKASFHYVDNENSLQIVN